MTFCHCGYDCHFVWVWVFAFFQYYFGCFLFIVCMMFVWLIECWTVSRWKCMTLLQCESLTSRQLERETVSEVLTMWVKWYLIVWKCACVCLPLWLSLYDLISVRLFNIVTDSVSECVSVSLRMRERIYDRVILPLCDSMTVWIVDIVAVWQCVFDNVIVSLMTILPPTCWILWLILYLSASLTVWLCDPVCSLTLWYCLRVWLIVCLIMWVS